METYKKKYFKYKTKYLNSSNKLIINNFNHKGGTTNSDYESLKNLLIQTVTDPTNYQTFVSNFTTYYDYKITKYQELKTLKKANNDRILKLTIQNKNNLINSLKQSPNYDEDTLKKSVFYFPNQSIDGNIIQVYDSNYNLLVYDSVINEIQTKKTNLTTKLKNDILEFIEMCDKLDTADMNNVRIEIIEYLLKISKGSININTYIPFNFILTGYPGIGKSYNANSISKLLSKTGLLCRDNITYIKKPDVIGQYLGQTAPKVYKKLSESLESIIFLDEAYSFAGPKDEKNGFDKYGQEALDAITDFNSEHQGLISIIAAGYPIEMKTQFLDVNPGLPRRFPLIIKLNRYKIYDILNITIKKSISLIQNLNTSDKTKSDIVLGTLIFIVQLVSNFDFSINPNIYQDIIESIDRISQENIEIINASNITGFKGLVHQIIFNIRNLNIKYNNTDIFRILTININRFPFDNLKGNGTGLEWFLLCNLLNKTTDLNDGDLFSFQASDINEYTELYLNTIILNYFKPGEELVLTKELFEELYFIVTTNIFKQKNITIEFPNDSNSINILDHNNYISSLIDNSNITITTKEQFTEILYHQLYSEYQETVKLEENKKSRFFTLFSLKDLRDMKKNKNEFINQEELSLEQKYIQELNEQIKELNEDIVEQSVESLTEKEQLQQQYTQKLIEQEQYIKKLQREILQKDISEDL